MQNKILKTAKQLGKTASYFSYTSGTKNRLGVKYLDLLKFNSNGLSEDWKAF